MDLNGIPLFSLISGRMSWLSARQSVLAENVANGDTPNYAARDIKPLDFQTILAGQGMGSTKLAITMPAISKSARAAAHPSKWKMRLAKVARPPATSSRSSRR